MKMKLRNKKTGEIKTIRFPSYEWEINDDKQYTLNIFDYEGNEYNYDTLAELNNEWEDYNPVEPLIKDEKVRKAVRAWSEMNDIRFIHMCSRVRKENARIVGQNAVGRTFTMEIANEYEVRVCFKDYKECYTIAELCGEEEE